MYRVRIRAPYPIPNTKVSRSKGNTSNIKSITKRDGTRFKEYR